MGIPRQRDSVGVRAQGSFREISFERSFRVLPSERIVTFQSAFTCVRHFVLQVVRFVNTTPRKYTSWFYYMQYKQPFSYLRFSSRFLGLVA